MQGESVGDAEKRGRNKLLCKAHIITKLSDHPGHVQPNGTISLVMQFHSDKQDNSSPTISNVTSRKIRV